MKMYDDIDIKYAHRTGWNWGFWSGVGATLITLIFIFGAGLLFNV